MAAGCSSSGDAAQPSASTLPMTVDANDVASADVVIGAGPDSRHRLVAALFGEALASVDGSTSMAEPSAQSHLAVVYVEAEPGDICAETSVVTFEVSPTSRLWGACADEESVDDPLEIDTLRAALESKGTKSFAEANLGDVSWLAAASGDGVDPADEAAESIVDAVSARLSELADDAAIARVESGSSPVDVARKNLGDLGLI